MVVLNYMGLHGEQGDFGTVLTNPGIGTGAAVDAGGGTAASRTLRSEI